jgi:hypothetical protein
MDMDYVQIVGFLAAALVILTLSMRTMVPLRIIGMSSNVAFITYGLLFGSYPTVVLHCILFPLNIYRLREMLALIKHVKEASQGDLSMDWPKPYMRKRTVTTGETLFRKGDEADRLFAVVSGTLHLREIDIDVTPGMLVGELGMVAPQRTRAQTLVCTESGLVMEVSYQKVEELYFQNPKFGFYFLRLSTGRLFENIARLERKLAERDGAAAGMPVAVVS